MGDQSEKHREMPAQMSLRYVPRLRDTGATDRVDSLRK